MGVTQVDHEYQTKMKMIEALKNFEDESKRGILKAVAAFYGLAPGQVNGSSNDWAVAPRRSLGLSQAKADREPTFSEHPDQSPKEFIFDKQPKSDVERVACLAYYLAHFRDTPHFKTIDISKLNTEAAQFKFSNAAVAVNNATMRGLLTSAGNGHKQISAIGERFVGALPDREAAKRVVERPRFRRDRNKFRRPTAKATVTN